jgi:D-lactate dehydrogenase (quinone)
MTDKLLQAVADFIPEALPKRLLDFRHRFEHHLILNVPGSIVPETQDILEQTVGSDSWFACDADEAKKAMLHRFAAAGAAVRYAAVRSDEVEDILALDIALRRDDRDWFETLPADIEGQISRKLYYGHFLCHVLHQDYVLKKGTDAAAIKARMLEILDARGAEYPAEHNVGQIYRAKSSLADHYRALDPTNSFNPGIGKTSRLKYHGCACPCEEGSNLALDAGASRPQSEMSSYPS